MFRVNRKSQVTVFIIAGLILLIGTSMVFILRDSEVRDSFEETDQQVVRENVDTDFVPLQDFMTSCVEALSREAILRVGRHGGYVEVDDLRANRVDPTAPGSNALMFWPRDDTYKIAYWWHLDSSHDCHMEGDCQFEHNIPELTGDGEMSVESQIADYVDDNYEACLGGFSDFEERGFEVEPLSDPSSDVTIASDDVFVEMEYPIEATLDERTQDMSAYNTRMDVDLQGAFEVASEIAGVQRDETFLETQLMELIALYSGSGSDALLPPQFTELQFGSGGRTAWSRHEVQSSLASLISSYVPMLSVYQASNFRFADFEDEFDRSFFDNMIIYLDAIEDTTRYSIDFDYKSWWDMYLQIGDSDFIEPESFDIPFLSDIPMGVGDAIDQVTPTQYSFSYDVSYPIMGTVSDSEAFEGRGFTLNFAMETNLRSGMPMTALSDTGGFDTGISSSFLQSRFCRPDRRVSDEFAVNVIGSHTGEAIEGATVEYECAAESCHLGSTQDHGDGTYFEGAFPECIGGVLEVSAPGYRSEAKEVSIERGYDLDDRNFELDPVVEIDVNVKIMPNAKVGSEWIPQTPSSLPASPDDFVELHDSESVVLNIDSAEQGIADRFSTMAFFEGPGTQATIELVPGEYEVNGQLILDTTHDEVDPVVIPEETIEPDGFWEDLFTEPVELEEIEFGDMFPQGMVLLDDDHGGNWEVSEDDLYNSDSVTFIVIASPYVSQGVDLSYDDLDEFGRADYYSQRYRREIEPIFE